MSKIIFLAGLFPNEMRNEIEKKSVGVIQYAADALQWAIVEGLDFYTQDLKIINLPYIGSYPKRYRDLIIKSFNFSHNSKSKNDTNVGFVNLSFYKIYSRYYHTKLELKKVLNNNNELIIIYAIHAPFIKAAIDLKRINPSIKICLIVPDLPNFMGGSNNVFFKFLKTKERTILDKLLKEIDAFVLLSKYMYGPLNIGNRPWVRIEGIFNGSQNKDFLVKETLKTIFYTGTLSKRYGILNLINAFSLIKDEEYRLWICGDGDARNEINERSESDPRIINFGQIPREEVLKRQRRATVLVNPRTSEGEFTQYSFPSKIMEYLASGTPCIMHRLAGIPKEYFDYCFISENETPLGLYNTIMFVCGKEQTELNEFGIKAKSFILENKTPRKQCEKLYYMLKSNNLI